MATNKKKRLTAEDIKDMTKDIKEIPQKFKDRCEYIRLQALNGDQGYDNPRVDVATAHAYYNIEFKIFEENILEIEEASLKKTLLKVLKEARENIEVTYKKYCPKSVEKKGNFAVKFVSPPRRKNKKHTVKLEKINTQKSKLR